MTEIAELKALSGEAQQKFMFHIEQSRIHHEEATRWQGKALAYGELIAKAEQPAESEKVNGKPGKRSKGK